MTTTTQTRKPLDQLNRDDLKQGFENAGYGWDDNGYDNYEFIKFTSGGDACYVITFIHEGRAEIGYLYAGYDNDGTLKVEF